LIKISLLIETISKSNEILEENKDKLNQLVDILLKKEVILRFRNILSFDKKILRKK
jgi:ATP-dependent Zn protease